MMLLPSQKSCFPEHKVLRNRGVRNYTQWYQVVSLLYSTSPAFSNNKDAFAIYSKISPMIFCTSMHPFRGHVTKTRIGKYMHAINYFTDQPWQHPRPNLPQGPIQKWVVPLGPHCVKMWTKVGDRWSRLGSEGCCRSRPWYHRHCYKVRKTLMGRIDPIR